jgi:plastocyanin
MSANSEGRGGAGLTQLAAGFAVLISIAALLGVAFKLEDGNKSQTATAAAATQAVAPESLKLVVKSDGEKGKKGSDGNYHDAFLPADFTVKAGATVKVTVYNYDDMPHTFTSPQLGVNAKVPPGTGSMEEPGKITFTFQAPQEAGSYEWFCALPCDPWAMTHYGFMKGWVRVV